MYCMPTKFHLNFLQENIETVLLAQCDQLKDLLGAIMYTIPPNPMYKRNPALKNTIIEEHYYYFHHTPIGLVHDNTNKQWRIEADKC